MNHTSNNVEFDIFISYSRVDSKIVNHFVERFTQSGFHVWIDRDGIETGDAFQSNIISAIEHSAIFVFFSSESSNKSEWTAGEIKAAKDRCKPIIPIKLDASKYNPKFELSLNTLDYCDYTQPKDRDDAMERLLKTLANKLGKQVKESDITTDYKTGSKPRKIAPYYAKYTDVSIYLQLAGLAILIAIACFIYTSNTFTKSSALRKEDALLVVSLGAMMYCTYNIKKSRWYKWSFLFLDAAVLTLIYALGLKYNYAADAFGVKQNMMGPFHRVLYSTGATKPGLAFTYSIIIYTLHNLSIHLIMNSKNIWKKWKKYRKS